MQKLTHIFRVWGLLFRSWKSIIIDWQKKYREHLSALADKFLELNGEKAGEVLLGGDIAHSKLEELISQAQPNKSLLESKAASLKPATLKSATAGWRADSTAEKAEPAVISQFEQFSFEEKKLPPPVQTAKEFVAFKDAGDDWDSLDPTTLTKPKQRTIKYTVPVTQAKPITQHDGSSMSGSNLAVNKAVSVQTLDSSQPEPVKNSGTLDRLEALKEREHKIKQELLKKKQELAQRLGMGTAGTVVTNNNVLVGARTGPALKDFVINSDEDQPKAHMSQNPQIKQEGFNARVVDDVFESAFSDSVTSSSASELEQHHQLQKQKKHNKHKNSKHHNKKKQIISSEESWESSSSELTSESDFAETKKCGHRSQNKPPLHHKKDNMHTKPTTAPHSTSFGNPVASSISRSISSEQHAEIIDKFKTAKAISSDDYFGKKTVNEPSEETRAKFSNAKAISSDQYFDRQPSHTGNTEFDDEDYFRSYEHRSGKDDYSDFSEKFAQQAAQDLKALGEGASKLANKFANFASSFINDLK